MEPSVYAKPVDGNLPGLSVTFYSLAIEAADEPDFEKTLEEFKFRGGGDIRPEDVPPKVKEAFEKWYEKLMKR